MWSSNAATAECLVYTYKDGLLSAIAHDLQIRVTDWDMQIDPDQSTITARFNASSLVVDGAMRDGQLASSVLSNKDREEIRNNIINDVLHSRKHGDIRFQSKKVTGEGERYEVEGDLTMHGTTKPIKTTVRLEDGHYVADVKLNQPDFGIKPFSAMMGTLKVKPQLRVVLKVPKP
ncbi:MAG TPA: YceI family protein [Candidatus Xenobia bacterium]